MPFNPMDYAAFLPALAGLFMKDDPYEQASRFFSPGNLLAKQQALYSGFLASPAFSQLQRGALQSGRNFSNQLQAGLAQRGLNRTGIGTTIGAMAGSFTPANLGSTYGTAWQQAGEQALQLMQGASTMGGRRPGFGFRDQYAGILDALSKYLNYDFLRRNPGLYGAIGPNP